MRMRKNLLLCMLFVLTTSLLWINMAAADTRAHLLGDFLKKNQVTSGGFVDTLNGTSDQLTASVGFANIYLIDKLDRMGSIDKTKAQNWFLDRFDLEYNTKIIPESYFALKGCYISDAEVNSTTVATAVTTLLTCQNATTHGFATKNSSVANLLDTYYMIEFLYTAKSLDDTKINSNDVSAFVMSCWATNGFSGAPGLEVNPIDSFFGVKILERLDTLDSLLTDDNKEALEVYIESFYCDNEQYSDYFGGYSYTSPIPHSSIALTYFCVGIMQAIDGKVHSEDTLTWLLDRQSPKDFGFCDVNEESSNQQSSATLSYYAVVTILAIEDEGFDGSMSEEIWALHTNKWEVAGIIIGSIAGAILLVVIIWKIKSRY